MAVSLLSMFVVDQADAYEGAEQANLLIVNNAHISNVHCTVCYGPGTDSYIVKDYSSNGTFANSTRMQKGAAVAYPAGTVLKLADRSVEITLG